MGFSRQEYWSGLPFPSPGDLPDPGFEPGSPAFQADTLPSEPPGSPALSKRSSCWKARKLWKHRESFQQPRAILTVAFHWEASQQFLPSIWHHIVCWVECIHRFFFVCDHFSLFWHRAERAMGVRVLSVAPPYMKSMNYHDHHIFLLFYVTCHLPAPRGLLGLPFYVRACFQPQVGSTDSPVLPEHAGGLQKLCRQQQLQSESFFSILD